MATDFNKPVVTDAYATLLPGLVQAHKDLARMLEPTATGAHTNVPNETVRWNATANRWERYNGSSWVTLPIAGDNVYAISISGNAATATALATARTIGGVSFNGTANIDLPGVNTTGNQNTSGNAATATKLATARTIGGVSFDGTANINLPGVNTTGNQNTTGNAATATTAASCSGNAATASNLSATRSDWASKGTISAVVGQLCWALNGNGHTIFDGSAGISPTGYVVDKSNAAAPWAIGYPILFGDNGTNTFGVRVDSSRVSDTSLSSLGVGQTWQDVTGSRAVGTTYTNSTERTITVSVSVTHATTSSVYFYVGAVVVARSYDDGARIRTNLFHVPSGGQYSVNVISGSATLSAWAELR